MPPQTPVLPPRSILAVAEQIIEQVRKDEQMSDALDAYAPGHENVHIRWLSKLRGYEVTMRFDAETLDAAFEREDTSPASETGS